MKTERRYQQVLDRELSLLLPPSLEEYVSTHKPVRAIDLWVRSLDLQQLGFRHTDASSRVGQPAYDPAVSLKLYLFGYQRGGRSSRKLEYQTHCNTEVMWLCQGARPSYKTIANFRNKNLEALKAAQSEFVLLCRELELFGGRQVAIDSSFLKANASKDSMYTSKRLQRQVEQLDAADHQEAAKDQDIALEDPQLAAKLECLQQRQAELKQLQEQLDQSGEKQISTVDKDAPLSTKKGETTGGYNAQLAVDDKHKQIVAQTVLQDGNDTQQLASMTHAVNRMRSFRCSLRSGRPISLTGVRSSCASEPRRASCDWHR